MRDYYVWLYVYGVCRVRAQAVHAMISRWKLRALLPCFYAWQRVSREEKARRLVLMRNSVLRLQNRSVWVSWREWTKHTEAIKVNTLQSALTQNKRKQAEVLIKSGRTPCLKETFQTWRQFSTSRRHQKRALLGKTCVRISHASLWRSWRQWHARVDAAHVEQVRSNLVSSNFKLAQLARHSNLKRAQLMSAKKQVECIIPVFIAWRTFARNCVKRRKQVCGIESEFLSWRIFYLQFSRVPTVCSFALFSLCRDFCSCRPSGC
jgi:hypothetical protein